MSDLNRYAPPEAPVADREAVATRPAERRRLVPLWIRIFGGVILLFGAAVPVLLVVAWVTGAPVTVSFLGLDHHGSPGHPVALLVLALTLSHAVAAYGLLAGQPWGVRACMAVTFLGVVACLGGMAYSLFQGQVNVRLELVVQALFLRRLALMRPLWGESTDGGAG